MPEPYTPDGSKVTFTVPSLDDYADGPQAFRDFADSIPEGLSAAIPVHTHASDCTLALNDEGAACIVDCSAAGVTNYNVTVPSSKAIDFPIGTAVVVGNVGTNRKATVTIVAAEGVTIRDTAVRKITNNRMVVLLKVAQDSWIINAGAGGPSPGSVPSPPKLTDAIAGPASVQLKWTPPQDDGGHALTLYAVEESTDGTNWKTAQSTLPTENIVTITDLKPATEYQFRVRAANMIGLSDPSNVLKATPISPFNDAEGGTVTYYAKDSKFYKVHTFTTSGNLIVHASNQSWEIFMVGAGGQGGAGFVADIGYGGYKGAGGGAIEIAYPASSVPAGTHVATVGVCASGDGQDTKFLNLTAGGGAAGGWTGCPGQGWPCDPRPGRPGSQGGASNGGTGGGCTTGSTYPAVPLLQARSLPTSIGDGGAGTGQDSGRTPGKPGNPGIVVVSYEVASIPKGVLLLSEETWRDKAASEAGEA